MAPPSPDRSRYSIKIQLCFIGLLALLLSARGAVADDPVSPPVVDSIAPSPNLPATSPWNLDSLSQTPSFTWRNNSGAVRSLLFQSEPFNGKPTQVFAYYATPQTLTGSPAAPARSLPGIVLVHGGGGTAFREWVEIWAKRGYAAIAMDLTGHAPIEGKNEHQPENRAAVPVYGCGFLGDNSAWLPRLDKMTPGQRSRWIALWDPSSYLPAATMPIFFVNGTNDFAYPLDSYMKSYAAVPGEKRIRITVNMPHSHQAGWEPAEIGLYVDSMLLGGESLPDFGEPRIEDGRARATCSSPLKLTRAALHYTIGAGPINKREWVSVDAEIAGDQISCAAPPENATAWFMTATDERSATASTVVVIRNAQ